MAHFYGTPPVGPTGTSASNYSYIQTPPFGQINGTEPNTITCLAGGAEMLRVGPDGFWVRGVKVEQDKGEAQAVYNAFKQWMVWASLNKDYK